MLIRYNDIKRLTIKAAIKTAPAIMLMLSVLLVQSCCRRHRTSIEDSIELSCTIVSTTKAAGGLANNLDAFKLKSWNGGGNNRVGFGVFGRKTNSDNTTSTLLFDNAAVFPTDATCATWEYTPIRYWDSNPEVSYQFIAYWPHVDKYDGTNAPNALSAGESANKTLTIYNIPNWQDGNGTGNNKAYDFMTSPSFGHYRQNSGTPAYADGKVSFSFYHILAKLVVKAYFTGNLSVPVKIYGITLKKGTENGATDFLGEGTSNYTQLFNQSYELPYYGTNFNGYSFGESTVQADNPFTYNQATQQNQEAYKNALDHTLLNVVNPDALSATAFCAQEGDTYVPDIICEHLMVPCDGWNKLALDINCSIGNAAPTTKTVTGITFSTTLRKGVNEQAYTGRTFGNHSYEILLLFNTASSGIEAQTIVVNGWTDADNIDDEVYNW